MRLGQHELWSFLGAAVTHSGLADLAGAAGAGSVTLVGGSSAERFASVGVLGRVGVAELIRGITHRRSGSTSKKRALTNKVAGTAGNAPTPPRMAGQTISERKLSVGDRPTELPTTRGWMTLWMMMLSTQ